MTALDMRRRVANALGEEGVLREVERKTEALIKARERMESPP